MSEFRMPSLGADMESATLIQWLVKPGDEVKKGDVILVVETNKGAIEVEVFESGVVEKLLVSEQEKVPVGTPLALIRTAADTPTASAAKPAPRLLTDIQLAAPVAVPPVKSQDRVYASPAARQMARQANLNLSSVLGSGPKGAVLMADIAVQKPELNAPAVQALKPGGTAPVKPGFNPDAMRQAIAAAMARSKREIPHYYMAAQVDMSAAQHWLEHYNESQPPESRLLMSALLLKATALALREFPEMNGFYRDGKFSSSEGIHPGFAISMRGGGLLTPAIHDVDQLALPALMEKLQDLVQRARRGLLRSSEMTDSTITLTALGERGVEQVFGVIYPPQVAIVGFGKLTQRPWVVNDALAIRPIMDITLAADHRVSDGHRGGLFLTAISEQLQLPTQL